MIFLLNQSTTVDLLTLLMSPGWKKCSFKAPSNRLNIQLMGTDRPNYPHRMQNIFIYMQSMILSREEPT